MTSEARQTARDTIAALRERVARAERGTSNRAVDVATHAYVAALERVCDELLDVTAQGRTT